MFSAIDHPLQECRLGIASDRSPPEEGKGIEEQSGQDNHQSPFDDLAALCGGIAARKRQVGGDAHDEEEKREDQVRRRPPVPAGMLQRRIDRRPASRIVDQQHASDGQPSEHIERHQPLPRRRHRSHRARHLGLQLFDQHCHPSRLAGGSIADRLQLHEPPASRPCFS